MGKVLFHEEEEIENEVIANSTTLPCCLFREQMDELVNEVTKENVVHQ